MKTVIRTKQEKFTSYQRCKDLKQSMLQFKFAIYVLTFWVCEIRAFNIVVDENLIRNITPPAEAKSIENFFPKPSAKKFFGYEMQAISRDVFTR